MPTIAGAKISIPPWVNFQSAGWGATKTHIQYIKALKAPTESQKMLVELAEIESPTKLENRQLNAMVRLEKNQPEGGRSSSGCLEDHGRRRDRQRKTHARELIELGGIVSMVAFLDDKGVLTGVLLWAMDQIKTAPAPTKQLKVRGDKFITKREVANNSECASSHSEVTDTSGAALNESA